MVPDMVPEAASRLEKEQIMRRLCTLTVMLALLAPAIGCESCFLHRGEQAQPISPCGSPCDPSCAPNCGPSCAPGGVPAGGCPSCGAPTIGAVETMPGPADLIAERFEIPGSVRFVRVGFAILNGTDSDGLFFVYSSRSA